MGTKDLCLRLLKNMNIEVHEADDREDTYYFEYYGVIGQPVSNQ